MSLLTSQPYLSTGLNYVLTADVAKKAKGQVPRVYFVLLGESVGQVTEKLQLVHMEETCHHYVAHVKVSPAFYSPASISVDIRFALVETTFVGCCVCSDSYSFISQGGEYAFLLFKLESDSLFIYLTVLVSASRAGVGHGGPGD